MIFVPILNTLEGLSLTHLQWHNCGVTVFCYEVNALLQRPGYPNIFDLKKDLNNKEKVILDFRNLTCKQGMVLYRTPDGALKKIAIEDLKGWVMKLNADAYVSNQENLSCDLENYDDSKYKICNQPAQDAFAGICYNQSTKMNLLAPQYEQDFYLLAENCDCESCMQGVTRSYLHHLLLHTPLLAQRYLVMHNVRQQLKIVAEYK